MSSKTVKVQVTNRYGAPAEAVYDAFLDPKKASKFMFATTQGKMIKAEIDARVGGGFVFIDKRETGEAEHYGTYLELTRPKRIAFKFAVQKNSPKADPVTIEITPVGKGCQVTLTHEMPQEFAPYQDKVEQGWAGILDGLAEALWT